MFFKFLSYYLNMSIGIIAEYNPFHNGHIYQLKKAKEFWPGEEIIVIMSGKYVQRGEIAIASFEERKKMAIEYGATKVVELPFEFATQAAHVFARGAVMLANDLKIDKLFFGSESNDVENLMQIAKAIETNKQKYNLELKKFLKQGLSFPKSACQAVEAIIGQQVRMPNDILGLEYCKVIVENDLPITPYSIARTINFHAEIPEDNFASASFIRSEIKKGNDVSKYTPMKIKSFEKIEDYYDKFQEIVRSTPSEELAKISLVSEGMENLFKKNIDQPTYDEFVNKTNSKRYTSSRIKRVMLYILLGIKKEKYEK